MDSNLQYRAVNGRVCSEGKRLQPATVENVGPRKPLFSGSGGRDQLSGPQRSASGSMRSPLLVMSPEKKRARPANTVTRGKVIAGETLGAKGTTQYRRRGSSILQP